MVAESEIFRRYRYDKMWEGINMCKLEEIKERYSKTNCGIPASDSYYINVIEFLAHAWDDVKWLIERVEYLEEVVASAK